MSLRPASEQLAGPRHHARLVVNRARDQEGHLDAFFAATARDLRHAEAAVSHAADGLDVDEIPHRLSAQPERSVGLEALIAADVMDPAGGGNSREAHVNNPSTTKLPR